MIKQASSIKNEFELAYKAAHNHWDMYLAEAQKDALFIAGDQWSRQDKTYLALQNRHALVFNNAHRIKKVISGYQRKNRLSFRVDPIESSDEATASQFTAILLYIAQYANLYNTMSDGFESSLATGISLINIYMDYSDDIENGDIRFKNIAFNKFLLDPNFSDRGLADCQYILRREYISQATAEYILPEHKSAIKEMGSSTADNKYNHFIPAKDMKGKDLFRYDEMYVRTFTNVTHLIDPEGKMEPLEFDGTSDELKELIQQNPSIKVQKGMKPTVELRIIVNDKVLYKGDNPDGLDDLPYVPIMCFFQPEISDAKYKLQSVARIIRDPQIEMNKRISKMLDIIDKSVSSGWKAEEGAVVDDDSLYKTGQQQVIFLREGKMEAIKEIRPPEVPQGLFMLNELFNTLIMEIPGVNNELLGVPTDQDVAGVLAKMRSGAALTTLQDLFDNYRLAKKYVGQKMVKMIQTNWSVDKIRRILNEQPSPEFMNSSFGKYDAVLTEGHFSDTQRHMAFAQVLELQRNGIQIPGSYIVDLAPIEKKEDLKKHLQQQEKIAAGQAEKQRKLEDLQMAMVMSEIEENQSMSEEKSQQAIENRTNAKLNIIKAIVKIKESMAKTGKDSAATGNLLARTAEMELQKQEAASDKTITTEPQTSKLTRR